MAFLNRTDQSGRLTIGGVPMHTEAWRIIDLTPLWFSGDVRGSDRLIPGLPGVIPYRRRRTVTSHRLPMFICGDVDIDGAIYDDPWQGFEANIDFLRLYVVDPTNATDGTRAASLTMPSGEVRTADIHVLSLTLGDLLEGQDAASGAVGVGARATLEISIPAGAFT